MKVITVNSNEFEQVKLFVVNQGKEEQVLSESFSWDPIPLDEACSLAKTRLFQFRDRPQCFIFEVADKDDRVVLTSQNVLFDTIDGMISRIRDARSSRIIKNKVILYVSYSSYYEPTQKVYDHHQVVGVFDEDKIKLAQDNWIKKNQDVTMEQWEINHIDDDGNVIGDPTFEQQ